MSRRRARRRRIEAGPGEQEGQRQPDQAADQHDQHHGGRHHVGDFRGAEPRVGGLRPQPWSGRAAARCQAPFPAAAASRTCARSRWRGRGPGAWPTASRRCRHCRCAAPGRTPVKPRLQSWPRMLRSRRREDVHEHEREQPADALAVQKADGGIPQAGAQRIRPSGPGGSLPLPSGGSSAAPPRGLPWPAHSRRHGP
jgi:hypothetical protein